MTKKTLSDETLGNEPESDEALSKKANVRIAVVTGGTRGIGAEVARRLASAGYRTIALARSVPERQLAAKLLPGVEVMACDVTDAQAVASTFDAIAGSGSITVLVNNAGISTSNPLLRTSVEEWNQNMAVNATGPFLCSRAALGGMVDTAFGRIVTVASTASLRGSPYIAAYAASKHAVLGLMRVMAAELDGSGVSANTVCPTFVRTEMTIANIANIAKRTGCGLVEAEAKLARATPHGRILEIDEVATAVMDLIGSSDNGQEVLLDGGSQ